MEIPMGSFQVCDVMNIVFKLEKPLVEHFEGFILLLREKGELQKFFQNSSLEIPTQELERIPPLDQQKLVHQWLKECLW
jgi:hypothetical protein